MYYTIDGAAAVYHPYARSLYGKPKHIPRDSLQTATGNIINDRAGSKSLPGLECRRWTGFIDVEDTDVRVGGMPSRLPNSLRSNGLLEATGCVMVLPVSFKVNHFAISLPLVNGGLRGLKRNPWTTGDRWIFLTSTAMN
jgi:hypothetical protein